MKSQEINGITFPVEYSDNKSLVIRGCVHPLHCLQTSQHYKMSANNQLYSSAICVRTHQV